MSYDLQVRQRPDNLPEVADPYGSLGVDGNQPEEPSIFARVHRLLRGRYIWAILLAATFGATGAFLGYRSREVMWSCTGMVHIKPYLDPVVSLTIDNGTVQNYAMLRQQTVSYIRSQRVLDMALNSPDWINLGRGGTTEEVWPEFVKQVNAFASADENVRVSFTDADPKACSAAVKSIIRAYKVLYIDQDRTKYEQTKKELDSLQVNLRSDRDHLRETLVTAAREYSTDDVKPLQMAKFAEEARLSSEIEQLNIAIANEAAGKGANGLAPQPPARKRIADMTAQDIAQVDQHMGELVRQVDDLQINMDLQAALGVLPNNPRYIQLATQRDVLNKRNEEYATKWRKAMLEAHPDEGAPVAIDPAARNREKQAAQLQQLTERWTNLKKEIRDMGVRITDIERIKSDLREADHKLDVVENRINNLKTEMEHQTKIDIFSEGERPTIVKDERFKMGAGGGLAGVLLGFGLVLLRGLSDRSVRSLDDVRLTGRLPLLGILPELPEDLADPEQASIAAHCVHQIRTLLQIGHASENRRVFAITSPAAGTGKTSLTLALGVSFAAANSKTLIIDCDVVGGGLTARVETIIRRKIGQIFFREGKISQQQLETALRLARNSQRKLGEILIELGYLAAEDVERALATQDESPVGMLDALRGDPLLECVAETGIQGLSILPIGAALPTDVTKLSPASVRQLLAHAREHFDVVIIDTGPIPGSLEASAASAAADGVVLVVSRGEHRPVAEKSIRHLAEIGASLVGMVFNRARSGDMDIASTTTRLTSFDRTGRSRPPAPPADARLGPVASAVATSAPPSSGGTRPNQQS